MESFKQIYARAAERKGGKKVLEGMLPQVSDKQTLINMPDSDYLSAMAKKIFQSGFVWRVVENKWPGFEQVLWGFEPQKLALASDEQIEKMAQDKRIIRNLTKVKAVRENAYFIKTIARKHQGFGQFIAEWPEEEITLLWLYLKKNGSRLGGNTGPYFLRASGKSTFLLTRDIVGYLVSQNIVTKHPSSQRDLKLVQAAFNEWQQQSGRHLSEVSRIISLSTGDNIVTE
ncbi:DNA-3-methyladenine glycosylase I [Aliikangiella sp. IMCC44359]|uniref:DNA-3-methyladenine glycosylase I n=1 Tax=Aliikangiella sp. IMCC44359 TaxID=3459125 RepID=UPI00403B2162